jgi:hypothetical protein
VQQEADAEVTGVVDGGFGRQSPVDLAILLDPGTLVVDLIRERL